MGIVTCILRTQEEQTARYAQGREDIVTVTVTEASGGAPPIEAETNWMVTHARPGQRGGSNPGYWAAQRQDLEVTYISNVKRCHFMPWLTKVSCGFYP